jgi:hypothetical protein
MVVVIAMMVILLSITGAALLFSGLNLKTASNVRTGGGAIHAADAGVQHGLALIPSGTTFSYGTETTLLSSYSFGSGYTYTVTAINDSASSGGNTRAIVTSVASGPNNSKRKIKAYIGRSSTWIPPGTIYIPGQPENILTTFNGSSFQISGSDTNPGGALGSGSSSPVPGIATTASGTTTEITGASGSLSSSQYGQVTGQGSAPSVATSSTIINVYQLAADLIALGVEGVDKQTLANGTYSSGEWGTSSLPKITHITGDATLTGSLAGYGVIIVDGNLTFRGQVGFKGLVIARGNEADIAGSGSASDTATVWGAVLVKEVTSSETLRRFGGAAKTYYSSQALAVVTNKWGSPFNSLPKAAKLLAWHEVMQ